MEIYLIAVVAIIFMNALPAFAPPTWMALVFFLLHYDANPVALVILGVLGAAAIAATNFGELLIHELRSPWAIGVQIVMIAGLIALGSIDWKSRVSRFKR